MIQREVGFGMIIDEKIIIQRQDLLFMVGVAPDDDQKMWRMQQKNRHPAEQWILDDEDKMNLSIKGRKGRDHF